MTHAPTPDREGYGLAPSTVQAIEALGAEVIDTPLISEKSAPYLDERLLSAALGSLV